MEAGVLSNDMTSLSWPLARAKSARRTSNATRNDQSVYRGVTDKLSSSRCVAAVAVLYGGLGMVQSRGNPLLGWSPAPEAHWGPVGESRRNAVQA